MADLVFAFDPALDRPVPRLDAAPPDVAEAVAHAAAGAFQAAIATARSEEAAALVLCGRILDPRWASPAQAAVVRASITDLAARGCRTVWLAADSAACAEAARMLGEPAGLEFATPVAALQLEIRGMSVEIAVAHGPQAFTTAAAAADAAAAHRLAMPRRIVVGWDAGHLAAERWNDEPEAADLRLPHGLGRPAAPEFRLVCSRRPFHPGGDGVHHLPALQARSAHEAAAGCCGVLTLLDHPAFDDADAAPRRDPLASRTDWRHHWREVPTHQVAWRTIKVASATGGDEELAAAIWSALESLPPESGGPLEIIRCHVECGTSVDRRVRVAEISAETLARVRQLSAARTFRGWCHEIVADPGESLVALGHSRSGAKPGSTTSFSTALADIVTAVEQQPLPAIPADLARESAWLALELIESG